MNTSFKQWKAWFSESSYTVLPYIHKWSLGIEEQAMVKPWFVELQRHNQYSSLLESGKVGRYTYLGLHPVEAVYGQLCTGYIQSLVPEQLEASVKEVEGTPLQVLRQYMSQYKSPKVDHAPKLKGGLIGYLGYDVIRSIEKLPSLATKDVNIPDYYMLRFNDLWVYDELEQTLFAITHFECSPELTIDELELGFNQAEQTTRLMEKQWLEAMRNEVLWNRINNEQHQKTLHMESESLHINLEQYEGLQAVTNKEQFMDAVEKIKAYIAAGDVFQVNLSQRQHKQTMVSGTELYEWLRLFNPSPYMGYFSTPQLEIVSASPELLVELRDGVLATRPIAGTRRRGRTMEEEETFVQELLTNEKEKAEHIMLVDLERNDLGRVSTYGTVKVKELMVIERYSHVMHLVSQIEGELAAQKDGFDVIAATFPGGTITGAPKIRTMEIIEELEPVQRGIYTGSLGWIDYCGDMELNIVIRTMLLHEGHAYVQAGAGVVIDSNPEREYYESLNKAKALWKALQYAETFTKHIQSGI